MSQEAVRAIEDAIDECLNLKALLKPHGSAQAHLLVDMLLLTLGRQLARVLDDTQH